MKWITILTLTTLLPLTSSAIQVTASYGNNTTDNDAVSTGNALTSASAIGATSSELTEVGTSTSAQGARFVGANSGRGVNASSQSLSSISQNIDVSVTWTIVAEDWEEYSISLAPEFHGYLNIEDGANDEAAGDVASFNSFMTLLTVNGSSLVDTLGLSGGSRNVVGSSNLDDTASQLLSGLSGNNTIVLTYSSLSKAAWNSANFQNNRTADAALWGMDGTMDGDNAFTDGFDEYSSSSARDADGLFVDAVVTLDAIPEPATLGLIGLFGGGIFAIRRFFLI